MGRCEDGEAVVGRRDLGGLVSVNATGYAYVRKYKLNVYYQRADMNLFTTFQFYDGKRSNF